MIGSALKGKIAPPMVLIFFLISAKFDACKSHSIKKKGQSIKFECIYNGEL